MDGLPTYVDVHGSKVSIKVSENGEVLVPLCDFEKCGFKLYKKSQYNKLLILEKDLQNDFHLNLLNSATKYLIDHLFDENKINSTFKRLEHKLTQPSKSNNEKNEVKKDFLKNRQVIEKQGDDTIEIKVCSNVTTVPKQSSSVNRTSNSGRLETVLGKQTSNQTIDSEEQNIQKKEMNSDNIEQACKIVPLKNNNNQSISIAFKENNVSMSSASSTSTQSSKSTGNCTKPRFIAHEKLVFKSEYKVVVSHIISSKEFYVQLQNNESVLDEIFKKTQEEEPSMEIVRQFNNDKVYMTTDGEYWYRCQILTLNPLTAYILDYGNVVQIDIVKELSSKLSKIRAQAIRIKLDKSTPIKVRQEDTITIKPLYKIKLGYCAEIVNEPQKYFFAVPNYYCTLQSNQVVRIISEENCMFFLRTQDCFRKLQQIKNDIKNYVSSKTELLDTVRKGQIILAQKDDKYYRAIVKSFNTELVNVQLLDYNKKEAVDFKHIRNINSELAEAPITYFLTPPFSRKVTNINEKGKSLINSCIETKRKFETVVNKLGDFDLIWKDDDGKCHSLIETLKRLH